MFFTVISIEPSPWMLSLWGIESQGVPGPRVSGGNGGEESGVSGKMEAGKWAWWWD